MGAYGAPCHYRARGGTGRSRAQADEHGKKLQHIMDTVPIKIKLTQGSCAGAGSGEFHIYRKVSTACFSVWAALCRLAAPCHCAPCHCAP